MSSPAATRLKVLIVEDNPLDAQLVQMAMSNAGMNFAAEVAGDGEAALKRLCPENGHHELGHLDLIILDLNLPKLDGTEVLQAIRGTKCLVSAPVVVVSSSPEYVMERRVHDANVEGDCYLTKPPSLDEFLKLGNSILECYRSKQPSGQ